MLTPGRPSLALAVLALLLGGCFSAATVPIKAAYEEEERHRWEAKAKDGNPEAEYKYGMTFCCGLGAFYNNVTASEWVCKAARKGYVKAQAQVGHFYRKDKGFGLPQKKLQEASLPQDDALASAWYGIAAKQGNGDAPREQAAIARRLTTEEVARSRQLEASFPNLPCEITRS